MSFTYGTLKTTVQNYLDEETAFVATLPTFITTAEERILKSVNLNVFRKNVTGEALTAGNTYLSMPSDYLKSFSLATVDSGVYDYLLLKHVSFMREHQPDSTSSQ